MRGWATSINGHWVDPPEDVIAIVASMRFPEEEARKIARSAIMAHGYGDAIFVLRGGNGAPAHIRNEFDLADVPYVEVSPNKPYWGTRADVWFYNELLWGCGRVVYLHGSKSKPPLPEQHSRVKIVKKERA